MSETPSAPTPATAMLAAGEGATRPAGDDFDYALGCECADPSLQIACWRQEASQELRAG